MDPERTEVAVVDPRRLDELVGVGQGVDVGADGGIYRAGSLCLEIGHVFLLDDHVVAGAEPREVAADECAERVAERLRRGFEPAPVDATRFRRVSSRERAGTGHPRKRNPSSRSCKRDRLTCERPRPPSSAINVKTSPAQPYSVSLNFGLGIRGQVTS
jgi:hypothetical protein